MPDPRAPNPHTPGDPRFADEGVTFDDVLLLPRCSDVHPTQTDTPTLVARGVRLAIPITSAAMDTVSEARLCVALARAGGLGFVHANLTPEAQAAQVDLMMRREAGMISDPVSLSPDATVEEAQELMRRCRFSGVRSVERRRLVGILTNRDLRIEEEGVPCRNRKREIRFRIGISI